MLFAHGPVGCSVALLVKRFFRAPLTRKRVNWLLLVGFLFGISPDFDLFYYYPFKIEGSHREFFTHSPYATLVVAAVLACVLFVVLRKREKYHILLWGTAVAAHFSHLLADSIGNGIRWLYPDTHLYGLALAFPFFDEHFFLVSFGLEVVFIAFFVFHLFFRSQRTRISKIIGYVFASVLLIGGLAGVLFVDQHAFRAKGDTYYSDVDADNVMNVADLDMDGDGILNLQDADANGNGIPNETEVLTTLKELSGVWYDPLNGSLLNLFMRLGFLLHSDVVYRAYDRSGIFFISEIHEFTRQHPDVVFQGNVFKPIDVRRAPNLFLFFKEKDLLLPVTEKPQLGDLAFTNNGDMVGVVSRLTPEVRVTMVVPTEEVMEYTLPRLEASIGSVTHWGRVSLGYTTLPESTPAISAQ